MPTIGTRPTTAISGNAYSQDPMKAYASAFNKLSLDLIHENGYDIFQEAGKVVVDKASNEAIKNFFVENSADYKC